MKQYIIMSYLLVCCLCLKAQKPFKGNFYDSEKKIGIKIDLYEESIVVPGMEMFGPMNGMLYGDIYGTWMITTYKIKNEKQATLRFSSDFGADTQEILLKIDNDTTYSLTLKDNVVIKRVKDNKLVKIDNRLIMKPKK